MLTMHVKHNVPYLLACLYLSVHACMHASSRCSTCVPAHWGMSSSMLVRELPFGCSMPAYHHGVCACRASH